MKRIFLSLAILLAAQIGFAQEEVAIEQNINQRINELEIYSGWDVHLIHHEADSGYRVAIITEDDLAARAYNVQLCNVKDSTLTILENTQLPRGTVVEIEGPMTFGQINLLDRATAEADYVVASAASVPEDWNNLNLCMYSSFHIRHYHIPNPENSPGIKIWDHAQLTIDTLSGEGDAVVNTYEGNFQYGSDILRGKITLYDYEATNNWPYQQTDVRVIKTKEVDGEITYTEHRKIWNNSISFGASIGYRSDPNPIDFESPFRHTDTRNFSWELQTGFRFSRHLGLNTGLKAMLNYQYLDHQVKLTDDGGLECIDGQTPIQKNMPQRESLRHGFYRGSLQVQLPGQEVMGDEVEQRAADEVDADDAAQQGLEYVQRMGHILCGDVEPVVPIHVGEHRDANHADDLDRLKLWPTAMAA